MGTDKAIFLGFFLVIAVIAGTFANVLLAFIGLVFITTLGYFLSGQSKKLKFKKELSKPYAGPYSVNDISSLENQVLSRLGSSSEPSRVKIQRFISLTGLWDMTTNPPPYLTDCVVVKKILFEINEAHSNNRPMTITSESVFRPIGDPRELQRFHSFCLSRR